MAEEEKDGAVSAESAASDWEALSDGETEPAPEKKPPTAALRAVRHPIAIVVFRPFIGCRATQAGPALHVGAGIAMNRVDTRTHAVPGSD